MNNARRKQMKTLCAAIGAPVLLKWHKPIITSVILPAHAQTSVCREEDILGFWQYHIGGDVVSNFHILEGGSATENGSSPASWTLVSNILTVTISSPHISFVGTISSDCKSVSGIATFSFSNTSSSFEGIKFGETTA